MVKDSLNIMIDIWQVVQQVLLHVVSLSTLDCPPMLIICQVESAEFMTQNVVKSCHILLVKVKSLGKTKFKGKAKDSISLQERLLKCVGIFMTKKDT
jgi:hypothetical protein